mmetsp:Transcript_26526/g.52842  ORF Transcript_26526/g.52842 Transcript_26526/m.52842 type:complete len:200 (+) Transcript_26526:116-715(+)|eukprot:CAMPEP_0194311994 /NCGR_PEP_ID=MMETSP0171-20130528/8919_1 /TAXON_ID=218684 /ORGANISM="Corethron pennatum, Strain L29A3" /LENGTH=199 /DNA_ID=CAMNT_0039066321 /DNA_START=84 /DNA_END=683 /DNA_ORIENTATION=-
MTSKAAAGKPTKMLTWEEFYEKTDNAEKMVDRVWYCVACTEADTAAQKVFWEHWYWKEGDAGKDLAKRTCLNHTKTISVDGKVVDYPNWPVKFGSEKFKMYPAIDLKCTVIAPIGMSIKPIQFPANNSRTEFRVDYLEAFGKKMYFIFTLDPLISEENKKKCFESLEQENGVRREWFHEIQWQTDYKVGSAGEPDINPK